MSNSTVEYMKSNIADLIYSEATIEGVGSTFEQTQKIIEEGNALGLQEWQLRALLNLKQAWQYLFDRYDDFVDVDLVLRYNSILEWELNSNAGEIRQGVVFVDTRYGRYYPPESSKSKILQAINKSWGYDDCEERALALLALVAKGQFCCDGNKRTAQLLANHTLALNDTGTCFCVPETQEANFKGILGSYYMDQQDLNTTINQLFAYVI